MAPSKTTTRSLTRSRKRLIGRTANLPTRGDQDRVHCGWRGSRGHGAAGRDLGLAVRDWRGVLYPDGACPRGAWLAHLRPLEFATVEVNNAFYRLPERSVFERWRERTPTGFVVAVKVSRYLTHIRRLAEPARAGGPAGRPGRGARRRGWGPYLLQLPPTLRAAPDRLDACLPGLPRDARVAVEPRHRVVVDRRGARRARTPRQRPVLGRPRRPPGHARCGARPSGATCGCTRARASPRPSYGRSALAYVAGPHRRRLAGPGRRRVRVLQQRPRRGRRPQRPHAGAHGPAAAAPSPGSAASANRCRGRVRRDP